MKHYLLKTLFAVALGVGISLSFAGHALAMTPTLSVSNNGYNSIQINVFADPDAAVVLDYYYNGSSLIGDGIIGYTNSGGYFSTTITGSSYNVPNGAQVLVVADGQESNSVLWQTTGTTTYTNQYPYTNNTSAITFSQTSTNVAVGQSEIVYVNQNQNYNTGYNYTSQYYISNYAANNIATATISGNAITLYGQNAGSATFTVCSSSNNGICASLYVTVAGSTYYNQYTPPVQTSYYNNNYYPQQTAPYYYNTNYSYVPANYTYTSGVYPAYQTQQYQYESQYPYNQNQYPPDPYPSNQSYYSNQNNCWMRY